MSAASSGGKPGPGTPVSRTRGILHAIGRHGALLALGVLVAVASIQDSGFLDATNLLNILRQVALVGIVAIGMTFVITSGGIDLSVGSIVALVGGMGIVLMNHLAGNAGWSADWAIAMAATVMVLGGAVLGAVNGVAIAWMRISPFIATLATMAIYRSIIVARADGSQIRATVDGYRDIGGGGVPIPGTDAVAHTPILVFVGVAIVAWLILNRTTFGMAVRSLGDNAAAARYAGVKTRWVTLGTYALVGACCGVAALLFSSRMNSLSSASAGLYYELDAIAAVVIGGTALRGGVGRIFGTVVGVVLLGVVTNMLTRMNVDTNYQGMVKGLIILGAVLLQRMMARERE